MRPRRLYARIYLYTLAVLFLVAICTGAVFSSLWRPALLPGPAERVARR